MQTIEDKEYTIKLTATQSALILDGLGKLSLERSMDAYLEIQKQLMDQQSTSSKDIK